MPPRNYLKGGKEKASPSPIRSSTAQDRSLYPDDKMAPGSHQTILTAPSSAMPVASLNHAAGLRDFCSGLSTQNYQASKSLRDSNWAEELSDNLDNTHHNPTSPNQPSPIETPKLSRWRAKGWKEVLTNFSNLLSNVKWDLTFWKPTNASKTMHTLGIEDKDDLKGVAAFWVSEIINYAAFSSLGTYNSRSGKLVCDDDDLRNIRGIFRPGEYLEGNGLMEPTTSS